MGCARLDCGCGGPRSGLASSAGRVVLDYGGEGQRIPQQSESAGAQEIGGRAGGSPCQVHGRQGLMPELLIPTHVGPQGTLLKAECRDTEVRKESQQQQPEHQKQPENKRLGACRDRAEGSNGSLFLASDVEEAAAMGALEGRLRKLSELRMAAAVHCERFLDALTRGDPRKGQRTGGCTRGSDEGSSLGDYGSASNGGSPRAGGGAGRTARHGNDGGQSACRKGSREHRGAWRQEVALGAACGSTCAHQFLPPLGTAGCAPLSSADSICRGGASLGRSGRLGDDTAIPGGPQESRCRLRNDFPPCAAFPRVRVSSSGHMHKGHMKSSDLKGQAGTSMDGSEGRASRRTRRSSLFGGEGSEGPWSADMVLRVTDSAWQRQATGVVDGAASKGCAEALGASRSGTPTSSASSRIGSPLSGGSVSGYRKGSGVQGFEGCIDRYLEHGYESDVFEPTPVKCSPRRLSVDSIKAREGHQPQGVHNTRMSGRMSLDNGRSGVLGF